RTALPSTIPNLAGASAAAQERGAPPGTRRSESAQATQRMELQFREYGRPLSRRSSGVPHQTRVPLGALQISTGTVAPKLLLPTRDWKSRSEEDCHLLPLRKGGGYPASPVVR